MKFCIVFLFLYFCTVDRSESQLLLGKLTSGVSEVGKNVRSGVSGFRQNVRCGVKQVGGLLTQNKNNLCEESTTAKEESATSDESHLLEKDTSTTERFDESQSSPDVPVSGEYTSESTNENSSLPSVDDYSPEPINSSTSKD